MSEPNGLLLLYRYGADLFDASFFNNDAGIEIGIGGKTTALAAKQGSGYPVIRVNVPAKGAFLRCAVGISGLQAGEDVNVLGYRNLFLGGSSERESCLLFGFAGSPCKGRVRFSGKIRSMTQ